MHQEIRHNLEDYLRGDDYRKGSGSELPREFQTHLGECEECANELGSLKAQSQLLRSLRAPQEFEPRVGFYARVMERIEGQPASMWSVLLDRRIGFRLAVASAALVALLGTYLVISEPGGPEFASSPAVVSTDTPPVTEAALQTETSVQQEDGPRQQQQRDAVLVDLASYHQ
jgi:anti-sigma factor RsiW